MTDDRESILSPDGTQSWNGTEWVPLETAGTSPSSDGEPDPEASPRRLSLGLSVLAAVTLAVGAFLPWVTIFAFGLSGVDVKHGYTALAAAALAGVLAWQLFRIEQGNSPRRLRAVCYIAGSTALLALASAIYVGFVIRDNVAGDSGHGSTLDPSEGLASFEAELQKAFTPHIGAGVWVTMAGAVLAIIAAMPGITGRGTMGRRSLTVIGVVLALAVGGGVVGQHQEHVREQKQIAKQEAEAKAADQQRAEDEAAAEAAQAEADAAAEADKQLFDVKFIGCKTDEFGGVTVTGTLINQSSGERSYEIKSELTDASGVVLDSAEDFVNDLGPGETARWEANGFADGVKHCGAPDVTVVS
ncbi:MAG: hypothetical protein JWP14_3248 [Frankiales bacterium]|nr:hypothetical protein [Frankiales bacterium]